MLFGSSVELINKLYQNEHKHKVGVDGWTAEQHLAHRKKYALDILGEIKDVLYEIEGLVTQERTKGSHYLSSQ